MAPGDEQNNILRITFVRKWSVVITWTEEKTNKTKKEKKKQTRNSYFTGMETIQASELMWIGLKRIANSEFTGFLNLHIQVILNEGLG